MEDIKFKIGTEEYLIKQTFRSLMLFEEMTGIQYENDNKMGTQFKMLYCILKAANRDTFKYSWDEFLDLLDNNQESVQTFFDYIQKLSGKSTKKKVVKQ
jgi:hypothetical protein